MRFDSLADFIAMGGHGPFVWSAYAIAFVVIVFNFVWPVVLKKRHISRMRQQQATATHLGGESK